MIDIDCTCDTLRAECREFLFNILLLAVPMCGILKCQDDLYQKLRNYVKVMPKILAVVYFSNYNKFVFQNSQGSAATQLRCGGKYYLYFVGNFMRLTAVKKF